MATVIGSGTTLLIGGDWVDTDRKFCVRFPYDGSTIAGIGWGDRRHAQATIDAAERAMKLPLPVHRRAQRLEDVAAKLREKKSQFARTIASEGETDFGSQFGSRQSSLYIDLLRYCRADLD